MSIFSFLFLLSFHFLSVPFSLFILPDLYDWLHNHPKYSWCGGTDVLTLTLHTSHHHKPGLEFLRAETGFDGLILTGLSDRCIVTGAGADWKGQLRHQLSPASPVWSLLSSILRTDWVQSTVWWQSNVAAPVSARGKVWILRCTLRVVTVVVHHNHTVTAAVQTVHGHHSSSYLVSACCIPGVNSVCGHLHKNPLTSKCYKSSVWLTWIESTHQEKKLLSISFPTGTAWLVVLRRQVLIEIDGHSHILQT